MTRTDIQTFLGDGHVIKEIIEDENELYAFFVSREYEASGGNDTYASVGNGPFYCNKLTGEHRILGAVEFHEEYAKRPLLVAYEKAYVDDRTWDDVVTAIKSRKHINSEEFEWFMTEKGIVLHSLSMSSRDDVNWEINCASATDASLFKAFFDEVELENEWLGPTSIALKNN